MVSLARTSRLSPEGAVYGKLALSAARLLHASCKRQKISGLGIYLSHQLGDSTPILLERAQVTCGDVDSNGNAAVAHLLQLLQGSLLRLD